MRIGKTIKTSLMLSRNFMTCRLSFQPKHEITGSMQPSVGCPILLPLHSGEYVQDSKIFKVENSQTTLATLHVSNVTCQIHPALPALFPHPCIVTAAADQEEDEQRSTTSSAEF